MTGLNCYRSFEIHAACRCSAKITLIGFELEQANVLANHNQRVVTVAPPAEVL